MKGKLKIKERKPGASKKNKITLQGLLYKDKFIFAFSVIVALIFWVFTAMTVSPVEERSITVPIKLDSGGIPEQYKLQMFGNLSAETVKVTVKGKKYIVGSVSENDVTAVAQTTNVDSAGMKRLKVSISKVNKNADFDIVSPKTDSETVEAYFDVRKEKVMNITADVQGSKIVADGYYKGEPILSVDTVKVVGPATEVDKVDKVVARVIISDPLASARTLKPEVVALDAQGAQVSNYLSLEYDESTLTLTIPVLQQAVKKTGVDFLNSPASYLTNPLKVTITPAELKLAGAETSLSTMNAFIVGSIDFNELTPDNNEFTFSTAQINDVEVLDKTVSTIKATVDMTNMTSRRIDLPSKNIQLVNAPNGYEVKVTSGDISNVRIVGPKGTVKNVKSENLFAILDLSNLSLQEGSSTMNVRINVQSFDTCWAAGHYSIHVSIRKK